jgi:hypothetical protein
MHEITEKVKSFPCKLLTLQSKEWKTHGRGDVNLSQTEGQNYVFFANEDGSELCWRVDSGKRFQRDSSTLVTFYCDLEQIYRGFHFENKNSTEDFWSNLQLALRLETESENVDRHN